MTRSSRDKLQHPTHHKVRDELAPGPCIQDRKDKRQRELVLAVRAFSIAVQRKSQSNTTTCPFDQHAASASIGLAAKTR
jgi:hypothetical protein